MKQFTQGTKWLAMAFLTAALVAGGVVAAWAATEFRLSNQLPPSHHISKGLVVFAERLKNIPRER